MVVPLLPPPRVLEKRHPHVRELAGPGVARAFPARRAISTALNFALIGLMVLSFVTGWIASIQGMTEFGLHKYGSIALLIVVAGHLALHWRSLANQLRRLCGLHPLVRDPVQLHQHRTLARRNLTTVAAVDEQTAAA